MPRSLPLQARFHHYPSDHFSPASWRSQGETERNSHLPLLQVLAVPSLQEQGCLSI